MNWIRRIFIVSAVFVVGGMASLINVHAETYGDYEYEINADGKTVTITKYMKEDEYDPETGWKLWITILCTYQHLLRGERLP